MSDEKLPAVLDPAEMLDSEHDERLRATAQKYSAGAIGVLAEIIEDSSAPRTVQVAAAKEMLKHAKEDDKSREQSLVAAIANAAIEVTIVKFGEDGDRAEHFTKPPIELKTLDDGEIVDADWTEEADDLPEPVPPPKPERAKFQPGQDPLSFPIDEPDGGWRKTE